MPSLKFLASTVPEILRGSQNSTKFGNSPLLGGGSTDQSCRIFRERLRYYVISEGGRRTEVVGNFENDKDLSLSPKGWVRRTKVAGNLEIHQDLILSPSGGGSRKTKVVGNSTNGQDLILSPRGSAGP